GTALAKLLFGEECFSGRLPLTFYHNVEDLPDFTDYNMKNRTYRYYEGKALYPFGFGLSYTDFVYENAAYADGKVTVTVKNVGKMDAEEVVQVYVRNDSKDAPLHPALCGFKRVAVKAGESVQVEITLSALTFTVVNDEGKRLPCEKATLFVGGYQPDAVSAELTGKKCLEIKL
ncbi:MAG: glycoside hydrolase family 3 C-terminal domain-containing protein, partial [Clostridia bacterium]|nr:glycoside hydrolase family 3 C-terminal domain-containing protein [Clostridia bacterium]